MAGKPAARLGDGTVKGGPIVQGSSTVLIGSGGGVACSVCPGGLAVGNPVNPQLGAKVLMAETDVHLPGILPFLLARNYSSYQTDSPAPVGYFGPGWRADFDTRLWLGDNLLILSDSSGRSIYFEPLTEGEITYSRSENLWLMRCGGQLFDKQHRLYSLWQNLPDEIKDNRDYYLACNSPQGPWWLFGYIIPQETEQAILPQPLDRWRVLSALIDRYGRQLSYERQAGGELHGHITCIKEHTGRSYRLAFTRLSDSQKAWAQHSQGYGWGADSALRLSAVYLENDPLYPELPSLPLVRYEYGKRGELIMVYDRAGEPVREFGYHKTLWGRMIAHRIPGRAVSSYEYDRQGRVIRQYNEGGLDYAFDYAVNKTTLTDSLGRVTVYHFKGKRGLARLVKLEQPDGSKLYRQYDSSGRLISQLDGFGRKTEYELDVATGQLTAVYATDGLKTAFYYNNHGQLTTTVYPNKSTHQLSYDELGRLIADTDPAGHTTCYVYPDIHSDLPHQRQDARGGLQQLHWDAYGQLVAYTDCSGNSTEYDYNRWGQLIRVNHPEGLVHFNRYNARGQLVERESPGGEITRYCYDENGDLSQMTLPDGSKLWLKYHRNGLLSERRVGPDYSSVLSQQFSYDAAGRLTTLTNENGAEYHFSYDVMDRLVEEQGFDGRKQRYVYNHAGLLRESDDNGRLTQWWYDQGDRLIKRQFCRLESEQRDYEERWLYDEYGQLISVSHDSQGYEVSVDYVRDKSGRIIAESQRVSDSQGQILWQHRSGRDYDELGQVNQEVFKGLEPIRWQTYGAGHLMGVALGENTLIEFERDRLYRERQRRFADVTLQSDYDIAGRLSGLSLTADKPWYQLFSYDKRGQLTAITGGREPISVQSPVVEQLHRFSYDPYGRLTEASGPYYHLGWRFDPAGNRMASFNDGLLRQSGGLCSDNRIKQDAEYVYSYDHQGNLTEKKSHNDHNDVSRYAYDERSQLIQYNRGFGLDQITGHYIYDAFGRRVGKMTRKVNGGQPQTVWYGWQGDKLVLTETVDKLIHTVYQPGSFIPLLRIERQRQPEVMTLADKLQLLAEAEYHQSVVELLDQIEQQLRDNNLSEANEQWLRSAGFNVVELMELIEPLNESAALIHLYRCDHLGTPVALISQAGKTDWQAELDPWGNMIIEENPQQLYQPIRLQGQHYDSESGLHYNRFRYYDPQSGRYITQDPIGLLGGMNVYQYPLNPLQWVDPLGLAFKEHLNKDCNQLEREIDELVNRNKHSQSNEGCGGIHGLKARFAEQIHGNSGPGTGGWSRHDKVIKEQQQGLRDRLQAWDYNNCGGGGGSPVVSDAWQWATKPAPAAGDWQGRSTVNAGDMAKGVAIVGGTIGAGYLVYRVIRFLPSLLPPLWATIPANLAIP